MRITLRSILSCLRWGPDKPVETESPAAQIPDTDLIEDLCRIICLAEDMNPDIESVGCGLLRPLGEKYRLWEARRPVVEAILIRYRIVPRTGDMDEQDRD